MSNELQMKLLACSTCGGELEVFGNNYRCKNCNNVYEITENISEEEIIKLNMANSSRTRLLFDDALEIYEQILDKNPTSSEANWGAFLCDYGVIYEKDKDSIRYLPTCHRINERPVEKCKYFPYLVGDYIVKAKEIESLRKRILSESQKVNGYDVFICYKQTEEVGRITKEAKWARGIYEILTYKHNLRVFFAERSLSGSNVDYEPHIYSALRSSKLMIVLASSIEHVNSPWVKNEWKRYSKYVADGEDKTIRVLYDDIEPYDLPKELQKKQAIDYNNLDWQESLIEAVSEIFKKAPENEDYRVTKEQFEQLSKQSEAFQEWQRQQKELAEAKQKEQQEALLLKQKAEEERKRKEQEARLRYQEEQKRAKEAERIRKEQEEWRKVEEAKKKGTSLNRTTPSASTSTQRITVTSGKAGTKSKMVALILAIFFGTFGIHEFYIGKINLGILHIVLLPLGISTIWAYYEAYKIFQGEVKDADGNDLI